MDNLQTRWDNAKELVAFHNRFRQIANTRGPGQTVLNLQLGHVEKQKVLDDISEANTKVKEWVKGISTYFGIGRASGRFPEAMKFSFLEPGYILSDKIDWKILEGYVEAKDIKGLSPHWETPC